MLPQQKFFSANNCNLKMSLLVAFENEKATKQLHVTMRKNKTQEEQKNKKELHVVPKTMPKPTNTKKKLEVVKKQPPQAEDNTYRTRMCRNDPLTCPYGNKCLFAHSVDELRPSITQDLWQQIVSGESIYVDRPLPPGPPGPP